MLESASAQELTIALVIHTRDYQAGDVLVALAKNGCTATERPHDRETAHLIEALSPEVVVLAVDPSRSEDVELINTMAHAGFSAVIVITPQDDPVAYSSALVAGADLCLRDSDGLEVVTAQLSAVLRRIRPASEPVVSENESFIVVRDLSLDFARCQAVRAGVTLPLTPTEFKILAHLARNAGHVMSPVTILRAVQEYTYTEREAQEIVKVYIRRIRRKVEHDPSNPTYVVNVRGFGYMLEHKARDPGSSNAAA